MAKLAKRWIGPYLLGKKINEVTFEVLIVPSNKNKGNRHVSEMKHFYPSDSLFGPLASPECEQKKPNPEEPTSVSKRPQRSTARLVNYRQMSGFKVYNRQKRSLAVIYPSPEIFSVNDSSHSEGAF